MFLILTISLVCTRRGQQASGQNSATYDRYWNDVAKILAGMEIEKNSKLAPVAETKEFERHRQYFETAWPRVEEELLSPMKQWVGEELTDVQDESPVFYPFSGPDFLNIFHLYSDGPEYYMFGLEKPGTAPDLANIPEAQMPGYLAGVRRALASILQYSFFQTIHMEQDLTRSDLGAAPVLMTFVARTGNRVLNAYNVYIGEDGDWHEGTPSRQELVDQEKELGHIPRSIPGIRILFQRPDHRQIQAVTFFSLDASNDGLDKNDLIIKFLKKKGPFRTFLKAASYLMYHPAFSRIQHFILQESNFILQDDSGMPLTAFSQDYWDLRFYGSYTRPIPLFGNRYQSDLRTIYVDGTRVRPLPFGIGYKWRKGESNLMAARRKESN